MNVLSSLTAADERLAAQLDLVADALQGAGTATLAAKRRLACALAAARSRLAGCLADVEALANDLAGDVLTAAAGDLLALPEPESCTREALDWMRRRNDAADAAARDQVDPTTLGVPTPSPVPPADEGPDDAPGRVTLTDADGGVLVGESGDHDRAGADDHARAITEAGARAGIPPDRIAAAWDEAVAAPTPAPAANGKGKPRKRRRTP